MCGIVGVACRHTGTVDHLLRKLKRLEYRGYDSCGVATSHGFLAKDVGKISNFMNKIEHHQTSEHVFTCGIAHTRWATHGGVTTLNSHPHHNNAKSIFVAHNGIIENYQALRSKLSSNYKFRTDTDTEIIAHYFDEFVRNDYTIEYAIQRFFQEVQGTYAVLLVHTLEPEKLYAFRKDSPLVCGMLSNENVVASDVYAFNHHAQSAIFFDDYEYAVLSPEDVKFFNKDGDQIFKSETQISMEEEVVLDSEFPHYMIKEIHEQPVAAKRLLQSLMTDQQSQIKQLAGMIEDADRTVFVACGTSYHASLVGSHILAQVNHHNVHNIIASEFDTFYKLDQNTLIIAISQSGETMDVVQVIKQAKAKGARVASLVNVPYSTIQRESDLSINILAGQEICVASTKAFTNQVLALIAVGCELGVDVDLGVIPHKISETIEMNKSVARTLAEEYWEHNHVFILGRGASYPVARECALKIKEISYMHAEGMMAGELKHGTIALIDPLVNTPVITLVPNNDSHMLDAMAQVKARGASVIKVSNTNGDFHLPRSTDTDFALYAVVIGQLFAYYLALRRGCEIDQPRNLAKSVTVR